MKKHFVTFFSPGTFVAEQSNKPVDSWDVETARKLAEGVTERYNATPYGFQFSTRERGPDDLDSKVSERSPMYYMNCEVFTVEQIEARRNDKDRILIANMRCNGWNRVVQSVKGWQWTQPLNDTDVVLS